MPESRKIDAASHGVIAFCYKFMCAHKIITWRKFYFVDDLDQSSQTQRVTLILFATSAMKSAPLSPAKPRGTAKMHDKKQGYAPSGSTEITLKV
jgi:hypothetical protein